MAQTGFTPILIYSSSTASNTPSAGNLTNSTFGSELAINITDGKLFYKDNSNVVQVIGWKTTPTSAGGTGLTSYTAGDLLYYAAGTVLSKLAIGSAYQALQVNAGGTAPSWQPSASSVLTAQGDLLYASAANTLARLAKSTTATRYLANTGSSNNPQWDLVNLTNGVTGTLPVANGGTGITAFGTGVATALGQNVTGSGSIVLATSPTLLTSAELFSTGAAANATIRYYNSTKSWYVGLRGDTNNVWSISDDTALRFNVFSNGEIGINTSSLIDSEMLYVVQSSAKRAAIFNVNASSSTANSGLLVRKYDNNNTTSQTYIEFQFNQGSSGAGGIQGNGSTGCQFFSSSDIRLKENIVDLEPQLNNILALQPRKFDFINGPKNCTGFIAQDFEKTYPDNVNTGPDGYMTIGGVSIMETRLIKALQEIVAKLKDAEIPGF